MTHYYDPLLARRQKPKWDHLSWITARALLAAINDVFARGSKALVRDTRSRWIAGQRSAGFASGVHARSIPIGEETRTAGFFLKYPPEKSSASKISFFVLGDPGDADASQYAVVEPLKANEGELGETDFMVFCSDIVYPAGDINGYVNAFYVPYESYDRPIFALPEITIGTTGSTGSCSTSAQPSRSRSRSSTGRATR